MRRDFAAHVAGLATARKLRIVVAVCARRIDCLIYLNRGGDSYVAAS
jgi:hypothetical protein